MLAPNADPDAGSDAGIARARTPRIPPPTPTLERAEAERQTTLRHREAAERKTVVRALLFLALATLLASFARAGLGRVFVHRWWHS